jgi:hypothetical protein
MPAGLRSSARWRSLPSETGLPVIPEKRSASRWRACIAQRANGLILLEPEGPLVRIRRTRSLPTRSADISDSPKRMKFIVRLGMIHQRHYESRSTFRSLALAGGAEGDFWYPAGATWNAPERVIADAPKPGTYMVYVNGYLIFGEPDGDRNEESRAAKTDALELKLYLE